MFGTAGLPHILMRFFTVSDASEARKSVFYATGFIRVLHILTFIIGFGAILLVSTNPDFKDATGARGRHQHGGPPGRCGGRQPVSFISAAFRHHIAVVVIDSWRVLSAVSHDLAPA